MQRNLLFFARVPVRLVGIVVATVLAVPAMAAAALSAAAVPAVASTATSPGPAVPGAVGAARVRAEVSLAEQRLAVNARLPHAGHPEALTHPAIDGLGHGSAVAPVSRTAGGAHVAGAMRAAPGAVATAGDPVGIDVSAFQPNINWARVAGAGDRFAIMKATEGTYYTSPAFASQYNGSYNAGLIRGAYHFAVPNNSSGAAQADFFVAHGGGWSGDGHTLPGMLDIEYNPYGPECYGLTQAQMVAWVASFDNEYLRLTGRYPLLYTNANWWDRCTGGSSVAANDPLNLAAWGPSPTPMPGGWPLETIWQYTDNNAFGYDGDRFNGTAAGLEAMALGHPAGGGTAGAGTPAGGGTPGGGTAGGGGTPGSTPDLGTNLTPGRVMLGGQELVSANHRYHVVMQRDGNLVLYGPSGPALWASATEGNPGARAVMATSGDLVVITASGRVAWSSRTARAGPSWAVAQDDGNFVIYRHPGQSTWASHTAGRV